MISQQSDEAKEWSEIIAEWKDEAKKRSKFILKRNYLSGMANASVFAFLIKKLIKSVQPIDRLTVPVL